MRLTQAKRPEFRWMGPNLKIIHKALLLSPFSVALVFFSCSYLARPLSVSMCVFALLCLFSLSLSLSLYLSFFFSLSLPLDPTWLVQDGDKVSITSAGPKGTFTQELRVQVGSLLVACAAAQQRGRMVTRRGLDLRPSALVREGCRASGPRWERKGMSASSRNRGKHTLAKCSRCSKILMGASGKAETYILFPLCPGLGRSLSVSGLCNFAMRALCL